MTKHPRQYTTAQVAALLNANQRTIQGIATLHNVGVMLTPRLRIYTDEDVATMRQLYRGKPGRPRKEIS